MSILTVAFGSSGSPSCKEGALKCGGGTVGGVVFVCMGGRWHVLMACRTPQICTSAPIAKCTSSPFIAGSADIGAPAASGFEIPAPEVSAATDYKVRFTPANSGYFSTNLLQDINNVQGVAADDTASGYDICSPCSRFNDACKTVSFTIVTAARFHAF